ncbi:MAG: DUF1275 domain-containing protein [Caulobacter sp.]|nr:DUF1275 domain-containing protein [Caulobacter sp.]
MTISSDAARHDAAVALATALAFVAGYVDVVGFVLLFGLFTAHATGNLVMLGAALIEDQDGVATKLLALPVFIATVGIVHLGLRGRAARGAPLASTVLSLQAALLAAFWIQGALHSPQNGAAAPMTIALSMTGVAAMAVQNAAARLVFKDIAPTTVMTGNVTQAAIDLVDLLVPPARPDPGLASRILRTWPPIIAFGLGAIGGAAAVLLGFGFWSLVLPTLVVAFLALVCRISKPFALGAPHEG